MHKYSYLFVCDKYGWPRGIKGKSNLGKLSKPIPFSML